MRQWDREAGSRVNSRGAKGIQIPLGNGVLECRGHARKSCAHPQVSLYHRNSIKLLSAFCPSEGNLVWFINTADGGWAHTCVRMWECICHVWMRVHVCVHAFALTPCQAVCRRLRHLCHPSHCCRLTPTHLPNRPQLFRRAWSDLLANGQNLTQGGRRNEPTNEKCLECNSFKMCRVWQRSWVYETVELGQASSLRERVNWDFLEVHGVRHMSTALQCKTVCKFGIAMFRFGKRFTIARGVDVYTDRYVASMRIIWHHSRSTCQHHKASITLVCRGSVTSPKQGYNSRFIWVELMHACMSIFISRVSDEALGLGLGWFGW